MKRLYYIFGLSALLLSSCNYFEYDNYEAPNSGLEGTVVDRKTNEPLQAEAANSYKVEYYGKGRDTPIPSPDSFGGKPMALF